MQYFDFDFSGENTSEPGWDFSSASAEKKFYDRNFVVSVNTFQNLNYGVGYCMSRWDGTASEVVTRYGIGNYGGACYASVGDVLDLNGRKDNRDMSSTPRILGQFSPDAAA